MAKEKDLPDGLPNTSNSEVVSESSAPKPMTRQELILLEARGFREAINGRLDTAGIPENLRDETAIEAKVAARSATMESLATAVDIENPGEISPEEQQAFEKIANIGVKTNNPFDTPSALKSLRNHTDLDAPEPKSPEEVAQSEATTHFDSVKQNARNNGVGDLVKSDMTPEVEARTGENNTLIDIVNGGDKDKVTGEEAKGFQGARKILDELHGVSLDSDNTLPGHNPEGGSPKVNNAQFPGPDRIIDV